MDIRRGIIAIMAMAWLAAAMPALAFDTYTMHPAITRHIAVIYASKRSDIGDQEMSRLADGSSEEDEPAIRVLHHFYDPIRRRGLSVAGIFLGLSSPQWSHASWLQSLQPGSGDCSWPTALYSYQHDDKAKAFRCLGHALHLLEDVTVPAHVRNDQHLEGDPFEQWAKYAKPEPGPIAGFPQPNCETDQECIAALALEVNMHFLSADTIDDSNYGSPFKDAHVDGDYLVSAQAHKLATYSPVSRTFNLTTEIHIEYWNRLSPLLIQYGQELLDIFFRETGAEQVKRPETLPDLVVELKNKHVEALRPLQDIADTARVFIKETAKQALPELLPLPPQEDQPLVSTIIPKAEPIYPPVVPTWLLGVGQPATDNDIQSTPEPPAEIPPEPTPEIGHVMISAFQSSGPLGSRDEWIELYNPTSLPISGADFRLQIADFTADPWYDIRPFEFSKLVVPPHGYAFIAGLTSPYAAGADAVFHFEFLDDTAGYIRLLDNSDNELDRMYYDGTEVRDEVFVPRTGFNQAYITSYIRRGLELAWRFNDCPESAALEELRNTKLTPITRLEAGWHGCGITVQGGGQRAKASFFRPLAAEGLTLSFQARKLQGGDITLTDSFGSRIAGIQFETGNMLAVYKGDAVMADSIIPADENWHHIAVSYGIEALIIYVDGIETRRFEGNFTISLPLTSLFIEGGGEWDEVLIWSRVLERQEIRLLSAIEL